MNLAKEQLKKMIQEALSEVLSEATFQDKVNAIKRSGKSEESAKKIAGAMVRDEKKKGK